MEFLILEQGKSTGVEQSESWRPPYAAVSIKSVFAIFAFNQCSKKLRS